MHAKHELQKSSQSLSILAKEKEELTREKANIVTSLTASEREVRQQNEVIAAYKSDKDALERSLWELNQANNKLENTKSSLESEKADLQQKVRKQFLSTKNVHRHSERVIKWLQIFQILI